MTSILKDLVNKVAWTISLRMWLSDAPSLPCTRFNASLKRHLERLTEGPFYKHLGLQHSKTWRLPLQKNSSFCREQQQRNELGLHGDSRIGAFCHEFVARLYVSVLRHTLVSGKSLSLSQSIFEGFSNYSIHKEKAINWTMCMRKWMFSLYYFVILNKNQFSSSHENYQ